MSSLLLSRRDLNFLLYQWLDVESLAARKRYAAHDRDTFDAVLDLAERIATEQFAPHNKTADANEPTFDGERVTLIPEVKQAIDAYAAAGFIGTVLDERLGGMQLPHAIAQACMAWFQAANVGTTGYPFITTAGVNMLSVYGSPAQVKTYLEPMVSGRFLGTMALSEPQAGSSLSDIVLRAEPRADGTYRLFGNKMWISCAEHDLSENIVHLVLARIPGGPAGVKGISLFVVPKFLVGADGSLGERNDVVVAGLNHKMGYRGTVNTLLNFGEGRHLPGGEPGAVGELVGEAHQGLGYMFHMMNEARVGVGLGATALGYTGYLKSLRYARERAQGRAVSGKDPAAPMVPIVEHADVRRMLLAQKAYVEGAMALILYCAKLVDDAQTATTAAEREAAHLLLDTLTPIAKSWPSQWCLEANALAIQVHGGYGYTREYDVEQHYRDNRLNPIHEGTHGIQALDLLGRKVVMNNGAGLARLVEAIGQTVTRARASDREAGEFADALDAALSRVQEVTARLWEGGRADLAQADVALANASVYLEAVGHVVVSWLWLEQLLALGETRDDFAEGKRQACRYFFRWELPKTSPQFDLLASRDTTTLDMRDAWFSP